MRIKCVIAQILGVMTDGPNLKHRTNTNQTKIWLLESIFGYTDITGIGWPLLICNYPNCSWGVLCAGAVGLTQKWQKLRLDTHTTWSIGQRDKKFDQFYPFLIFKTVHILENIKTSVHKAFNLLQIDVFLVLKIKKGWNWSSNFLSNFLSVELLIPVLRPLDLY